MGNIKIMTDNFIDLDVVSNATVSSEQTAFPVSNIYNKQRRSKVWRSNGYYEITSLNNKIVFQETNSVNLTATLTAGNYTTTTLFAHIKTQMEVIGDSTYTISQDTTTKRIKFVSNGSGGGGIFKLIWTSDSVTQALAQILGFLSTEDKTGALTYLADELKIGSGEWIKWDFGISTNPKAFALIGPRNKPIKISPSATLKLQGNETNVWTSPTYETTLTYNDSVISKFSDTGLHTEALRYWRLFIDDTKNPLGYVEVGSIFLGDFFTPSQGSVQFPFEGNYVDESNIIFSEGGQSFVDIVEQTETFSFEISFLTVNEKEQIDLFFQKVGKGVSFFIVMDPNAVFSSDNNYFFRYVKFIDPPSYRLTNPGLFSVTMNLREEL